MSELSPGSKATTNLFMILGGLALAALALTVSNRDAQEPATCAERLISMGPVVWDPLGPILHPGDTQTVTLEFALTPDGVVQNITVAGTASDYDGIAIQALQQAQYAADDSNPDDLLCSYPLTLKLE